MSDEIKYIDVDDEQFEDAPRALRDAYKALARQHKEATSELGQARKTIASHALGDVLGNQGFKNPKRVEKDLLGDGIDPLDKSAVESWLGEYGDDYAKAESAGEPNAAQQQQQIDPAIAAGHQSLNGLGDAVRQPTDVSKLDKAKAEITDDMSPEQVRETLLRNGL